jgi:hypothetical protein
MTVLYVCAALCLGATFGFLWREIIALGFAADVEAP